MELSQEQERYIASLREVRVFVSVENILGVPIPIVLVGVLLCGYLLIFISFAIALVLAVFYFGLMFYIHRDDPQAVRLWVRAFFSVDVYRAAEPSKTDQLIIIEDS